MKKYANIIGLARPESRRPKMSAIDRAAQFSAFAALVGLDEQMNETARIVDGKIELSEDEAEFLDRKLALLAHKLDDEYPDVKITYFVPDGRKSGGSYVTKTVTVKRIDEVFRRILLMDGAEINIADVLDFEIVKRTAC